MRTKPAHSNSDLAFNRLYIRLTIVLVVVAAVLLGLLLQSGPRLRTVSLDRTLVSSQLGQRIVLHANQPLAKVSKDKVRLTPAADFSVSSTADTITIALSQRLKYSTRYAITVDGVAAKDSPSRSSTFSHSFTTVDPTMYYLKRNSAFNQQSAGSDKLYSTTLYTAQDELLYSAPRILDYVILDKYLVVATAEKDKASRLVLVDKASKKVSPIELPEVGMVSQLHSAGDGTTYGFAFTSQDGRQADAYTSTLFVHDLSPGHILVPISGVAGKRVDVINWQFAPDRTTIVAQLLDANLVLIDGNFKHQPVPLGRYSSISNFTRDGTKVVVSDHQGFGLLDLVKRSRQALPEDLVSSGQTSFLKFQPLINGEGYLVQTQVPLGNNSYRESIELKAAERSKTLYDSSVKNLAILRYAASPNDQILTVETASLKDPVYDDYPETPRPLATTTLLVDSNTGKTVRTINGTALKW